MSTKQLNLKLGETIWESRPWEKQVAERSIVQITRRERLQEDGEIVERVTYLVSGGVFGLGEDLRESDIGKRYFFNRHNALAAMEQDIKKYRDERRKELESERQRIEQELSNLE